MGQFPSKSVTDLVEEALDTLQIAPPPNAVTLLEKYILEIIRWGRLTNLTGAADPMDFARGPLFDALTLVPSLEQEGSLVDVGSGGGLPGIPAAILAPMVRITLVEPRSKRASFLRHVVHLLEIDAETVESRDEDLPNGSWNGAVAQAVWPAPKWLDRARRLVAPQGAIYVLAARPFDKKDLPAGAIIEREAHYARPFDDAPRYAARIRMGVRDLTTDQS
ncbi:MAG: hypothetical protein GY854_28175 [Deltaproteobacteria bacterium]|nr:hypothetical protein [Deltaproteobacteria bacterium]